MEFFIPGLTLFLVSIGVTLVLAPKATPLTAAVLSIVFLVYGVYHHQKLFSQEYRLSTWQEGLKVYAPAITLLAVILLVVYGILAFFTSGQVPVPANLGLPSPADVANQFANTMESAANRLNEMMPDNVNEMANNVNEMANNVNEVIQNRLNRLNLNPSNKTNRSNRTNNKANKGNERNLSRSFLETV